MLQLYCPTNIVLMNAPNGDMTSPCTLVCAIQDKSGSLALVWHAPLSGSQNGPVLSLGLVTL
jgi:hypothetical protein